MSLSVSFLDVGDCHSTFVQCDDRTTFLIDTGRGQRSSADHLRNVPYLDHVLVTHPHPDHLKSLAELAPKIERFHGITTRHYPEPCSEEDKPDFDAYYFLKTSHKWAEAVKGRLLKNDEAGFVRVLAPTQPPRATSSASELNDASAIVFLRWRNRGFLIPGDNQEPSLRQFMQDWSAAPVDVLLAPQHGQQSGFLQDFVKHVSPDWVVIHSGPAKEGEAYGEYARLAGRGVWSTRQHGTITFTVTEDGRLTTNMG